MPAFNKRPPTPLGHVREFMLDLTGASGVPSQWGVTINTVSMLLFRQCAGREGMQLTSDFNRGVYNVTLLNQATSAFLASFKLKVTHGERTIEVPLRPRNKGRQGTWVCFYKLCVGPMAKLPNSFFNAILEREGCELI
jgi:hypothetical protein